MFAFHSFQLAYRHEKTAAFIMDIIKFQSKLQLTSATGSTGAAIQSVARDAEKRAYASLGLE